MKVEVNRLSSCKNELAIEVEASRWKQEHQDLCRQYVRKVRVPGFRPGRAPLSIVRQRYAESILSDFLEEALRRYVREAVSSQSLTPLSPPVVGAVDFSPDRPLRFKATFEVKPSLELRNYKGLEIDRVSHEVGDEEVESAVRQFQRASAEYVPVEGRPARTGDIAVVKLEGHDPARRHQSRWHDEGSFKLGGAYTPPEFTDHLSGAWCGESRTFDVRYPADHPEPGLAGGQVRYVVELKAIVQERLPELNDEFARTVGDCASLDDLRAKVRASCARQKEQAARSEMQSKLIDLILEGTAFDAPEVLVRERLQARLNEARPASGVPRARPAASQPDRALMEQREREHAIRDVKAAMVLERIAEEENLTVSETEVEEEITRIARTLDQPVQAVKSRLTKERGVTTIQVKLRNRKCLDLILSQASFRTPPGLIVQP